MNIPKSFSIPKSKSASKENDEIPAGYLTIDRSKIEARMAACNIKTQEALASELVVSRGVINRMLNDGYVLPSHLDDIARVLKTNVESLRPMSTYQEAQELAGVRARFHDGRLRAPQLGRGHHFHRLRDLLRRFDASDPSANGFEAWHARVLTRPSR